MPIKRRIPKSRAHLITPEAIEAFHAGDERALHRALGLTPWEASPLDANEGPAPYGGELWRASWPQAQALRRALLKYSMIKGTKND